MCLTTYIYRCTDEIRPCVSRSTFTGVLTKIRPYVSTPHIDYCAEGNKDIFLTLYIQCSNKTTCLALLLLSCTLHSVFKEDHLSCTPYSFLHSTFSVQIRPPVLHSLFFLTLYIQCSNKTTCLALLLLSYTLHAVFK